jgi:hypothetical protein
MKPDIVTLLDYYAAHAPATPLWDFPVRGYEKRPKVLHEEGECINLAEINAFDQGRRDAKARQWPFVWANAMLDERLNHI